MTMISTTSMHITLQGVLATKSAWMPHEPPQRMSPSTLLSPITSLPQWDSSLVMNLVCKLWISALAYSPPLQSPQGPPAISNGEADVNQTMEDDHHFCCVFSRVSKADPRRVVSHFGAQQQLCRCRGSSSRIRQLAACWVRFE